MKPSKLLRTAGILLVALIAVSAASAFAAANSVPASRLDEDSFSITANALKPAECAGINLTNIIAGGGNLNGTGANDLILGSASADNISGLGGNDCIVGGNANDVLDGGNGADVLLGGGGNDFIFGGQGDDALYGSSGFDFCFGGQGTDFGDSCEFQFGIP